MLEGRGVETAALAAGRDSPVITVTWHQAADGAASRSQVCAGQLRNPAALDYAAATAAITSLRSPHHEAMSAAHAAAHAMLARRRRDGALVIYDLIQGIASDGDSGIRPLAAVERHAAYVIVAEFMVAANTIIAGYFAARDTPVPFRVHQAATASTREQLTADLDLAAGTTEAWRREATVERLAHLLRPAAYSVTAAEHYGLRLPFYLHGTSPVRRYPDLIVQRQLLALIRGEQPPYTAAAMAGIVSEVNATLQARRERRDERNKEATRAKRRDELGAGGFEALDSEQFYRLLKLAAKEQRHSPALGAELQRRADAGLLQARDAYPALTAPGPEWDAARAVIIAWLADHPEHAVTLLSAYARNLGMSTPYWDEHDTGTAQEPQFTACAGIDDGKDGITWSQNRAALRKDQARQQAALSLLAAVASQPDPSESKLAARPAPAGPDQAPAPANPVGALNELTQTRCILDLSYAENSSGPSHAPEFTCTATGVRARDNKPLSAESTGRSRKEAKTGAAQLLLAGFHSCS